MKYLLLLSLIFSMSVGAAESEFNFFGKTTYELDLDRSSVDGQINYPVGHICMVKITSPGQSDFSFSYQKLASEIIFSTGHLFGDRTKNKESLLPTVKGIFSSVGTEFLYVVGANIRTKSGETFRELLKRVTQRDDLGLQLESIDCNDLP